jgi:hypothetical protein
MNKLIFEDGISEIVSDRVWNCIHEKNNEIEKLKSEIQNDRNGCIKEKLDLKWTV